MGRYAEIEDLQVPRGTLVSQALLVSAVDPSTDRIEVGAHGLVDGAEIFFVADEDGTLPAPLVELTAYYARVVSDSIIEVAASEGGIAINLTDEGTLPFRVHVDLTEKANGFLEARSRQFDNLAKGHQVPFTAPFPAWVTEVVAAGATHDIEWALRQISFDEYERRCNLWFLETKSIAAGAPVRDERATAPANQARGASPTAADGTDDWSVLP